MDILALIGEFAKANPMATVFIAAVIIVIVMLIKNFNTKHYFCTDCGYVVGAKFSLGNNLYRCAPCPRCGNNVASPYNSGQGRTYRRGGRNF